MKIIFFGTPVFASINLQYLINQGNDIVAVVTSPDSKQGRGKKIKSSPVKETAIINNISVLQPNKLISDEFVENLRQFSADIFVVVAFRMLPEVVWRIPNKGTINLHTSYLPSYRGAAPINRVLINGEKETGVTTFYINQKIDSGAIILQDKINISQSITAAQLHNRLLEVGKLLLEKTLKKIQRQPNFETIIQEEISVLEAPKLNKELLKIDWNKTAIEIHNLVRGLSPFLCDNTLLKDVAICPSAWFFLDDGNGYKKRIKLHQTKVVKSSNKGFLSIETDNKSFLHVKIKKFAIAILNLQPEGKKPMNIQQFLNGNNINKNHKIS